MLRSNDYRRSKFGEKEITAPAGRAEGTPPLLEKEKRNKKIASADDDMLEFHRLSRENFPSGFRGLWKKYQLRRTILRLHLHLHLHYSRGIEGIATPQKLGQGAGAIPILYRYYHVSCM